MSGDQQRDTEEGVASSQFMSITSMTPIEVCAELAALGEGIHADSLTRCLEDQPSSLEARMEELFREIQSVPKVNIAYARELYTLLARSEYRHYAATLMADLAEVDPELALSLWRELIGDPDQGVREEAYGALVHDAPTRDQLRFDFRLIVPLIQAYHGAVEKSVD